MAPSKLPAAILLRVLLRSFILQASWNFERLQSLGTLYVLAPALRFYYREEELALAYRRHLEYFNTHPFMASAVLGTALALEEKRSRGEKTYLEVKEFKGMIMAPYAAMGDALFWGGIRPLAAGIALFFAVKGSLWAPVAFLLLFNLPHLVFRVAGLFGGYRLGLKVVELIQARRLPDLAIRCKEGTVVLLGCFCAYLAFISLHGEGVRAAWGLAVIPAVVLVGWLVRKGVSTLLLVLSIAGMILLAVQLNQHLPAWVGGDWLKF
ncbi:hypothetical protein DESUT3_25490 [Desulfuromonas versatilis]|uniref:Uncharacterized protein n=1 Tax=Desulfuromonas versatilis TaxID=2802975 RepID=A0ABN6DZG1_9BACT|nr:PTS system mannose/fructose/sorbose family transporter subunit IID [Desulfuromonas versatilis]BCR05480.1 hypothetical protein DESUT3_25490 [Desulfuromonas versatilis]